MEDFRDAALTDLQGLLFAMLQARLERDLPITAGMAGDLDPLDGGQVLVNVALERVQLAFERAKLGRNVQAALASEILKPIDLLLDLGDRALEIKMRNRGHYTLDS